MFEYANILVKYDADNDTYQVADNLLGRDMGTFQFNEGPGWVFIATAGLIMDEFYALYAIHSDLQEMYSGYWD